MGNVTHSDILEAATFDRDNSGLKASRRILVENLTANPSKVLYDAALVPGVPQYGEPHESIPGLVVSKVSVRSAPDSPDKAWVDIDYESPKQDNQPPSENAAPTTEFSATVSEVETSRDAFGNEMTMEYVATTTLADGTVLEYVASQPFKVSIQEMHSVVSFTRPEPKPFNAVKAMLFTGKVNAVPWFFGGERTWLCLGIRASLQGSYFSVTYEFQYRESTWDAVGVPTDPSTGAPVEGADEHTFQVYQTADFGQLNLGV